MGNIFFERFAELCKENGETPNSVAKALGISSGSVTAWKNGTAPRSQTVSKLADYFHVSTDYLLGNVNDPFFHLDNERILAEINSYGDKTEKAPTGSGKRDILDDIDIAFYGEYRELTEDDKETVRDMVRVMRERRAKKQEQ